MASTLWEDKLIQILITILYFEDQIERIRKELSQKLKSPKALFNLIDISNKNYIDSKDIERFLSSFQNLASSIEKSSWIIKKIIYLYDNKGKLRLEYKGFINLIADSENHERLYCLIKKEEKSKNFNMKYDNNDNESLLLYKIFLLEYEFIMKMGNLISSLNENKHSMSIYEAFKLIDSNNDNILDINDIKWYLNSRHLFKYTDYQLALILFRIDKDKDGVINYKEFQEVFETYSCYASSYKSDINDLNLKFKAKTEENDNFLKGKHDHIENNLKFNNKNNDYIHHQAYGNSYYRDKFYFDYKSINTSTVADGGRIIHEKPTFSSSSSGFTIMNFIKKTNPFNMNNLCVVSCNNQSFINKTEDLYSNKMMLVEEKGRKFDLNYQSENIFSLSLINTKTFSLKVEYQSRFSIKPYINSISNEMNKEKNDENEKKINCLSFKRQKIKEDKEREFNLIMKNEGMLKELDDYKKSLNLITYNTYKNKNNEDYNFDNSKGNTIIKDGSFKRDLVEEERMKKDTLSKILFYYLKKTLHIEKEIEKQREKLIQDDDFNIYELYLEFLSNEYNFDNNNKDMNININIKFVDFYNKLRSFGIFSSLSEIKEFFKKHDTNKDGEITREEFFNIFLPLNTDYNKIENYNQNHIHKEINKNKNNLNSYLSPSSSKSVSQKSTFNKKNSIFLIEFIIKSECEYKSLIDDVFFYIPFSYYEKYNLIDMFNLLVGNNEYSVKCFKRIIKKNDINRFMKENGLLLSKFEVSILYSRFYKYRQIDKKKIEKSMNNEVKYDNFNHNCNNHEEEFIDGIDFSRFVESIIPKGYLIDSN